MHKQVTGAARSCLNYLLPIVKVDPVKWCLDNIDFTDDKGAEKKKLDLEFSPFLKEPIESWDFDGIKREVTIVAPEQTGKTLCWIVGLLWSFIFKPCISMVIYKSDEKAEEINSDKLKPLMRRIKIFEEELSLPRSNKKDHYNFSTLKSYFSGSGTRITSSSSKVRIADELDDWIEHEGQAYHLDDMRKRGRSFDEGILYKVCTPKQGGALNVSKIWEEFLAGSQGYYYLRCVKCNQLTMRSCDTHNLQFASEGRKVVPGSCILVCPACGYKASEDKKKRMIQLGGYIHNFPERKHLLSSFQWGCLASQFKDFEWEKIANAQLEAGASGSLEKQVFFDNSFRGLPFHARKRDGTTEKKLKSRCRPAPAVADISYRMIGIDTQGYSFWWRVRVWDKKANSYGVASGEVASLEELQKLWNTDWLGGKCIAGIIDVGGHRGKEVSDWINKPEQSGIFMYKGRGQLAMQRWEMSQEQKRLLLVNPNIYKSELIFTMYDMEFGERGGWYLEPEPDEEYMTQMMDYKPNNKKHHGNLPVNWESTGNEHLFDCEKMLNVMNDVFLKMLNRRKQ